MRSMKRELRQNYSPAIRLAVISLVLCGLIFPLVITGFAQVMFPSQANGSVVQLHGKDVGSNLIAQEFKLAIFFHPRNDSASGVDPDITVNDARSQIPRISAAANIPIETLRQIVDSNQENTFWIFGTPYANVLRLNLALVQTGNPAYSSFQ
jgi:potassium-transporting ATPase KdpC subunit